jgi:hypothetical protein
MTQYHVLASEGRQRYIYTKINPKNIKEKKESFCFPEKQAVLKIFLVDFKTILNRGKGTRK